MNITLQTNVIYPRLLRYHLQRAKEGHPSLRPSIVQRPLSFLQMIRDQFAQRSGSGLKRTISLGLLSCRADLGEAAGSVGGADGGAAERILAWNYLALGCGARYTWCGDEGTDGQVDWPHRHWRRTAMDGSTSPDPFSGPPFSGPVFWTPFSGPDPFSGPGFWVGRTTVTTVWDWIFTPLEKEEYLVIDCPEWAATQPAN